MDNNLYLVEALKERLIQMGYQVERHPQYLALIVNSDLEIATGIVENPNNHPNLLHLLVMTIHPQYFPRGIEENIVGLGTTMEEKVNSAINNYINTTLLPIIEGFSDSHNPALDFSTAIHGKKVLWHPKLGTCGLQGPWKDQLKNEVLFELIVDQLKPKLTSDKFN